MVDGDELLVPLADVRGALAGLLLRVRGLGGGEGLALVVLAVLKDLEIRDQCVAHNKAKK